MNITEVKKLIEKIPISSVLEAWDSKTIEGICPFHEDKTAGAFKYKDDKDGGFFKCFSCNCGGDKISFVEKYDGVDFKEAILRIARRFELINEKDYQDLSLNPIVQKPTRVKVKKIKNYKEAEIKSPEHLDRIYKIMMDIYGLNEAHKKYLLNRGIKENELKNYFSFSKIDGFFTYKMIEKHIKREDLIGVPGFYLENDILTSKDLNGIGIPLHNADGLITAIQIRKDKVEKGARYVFFSSPGKDGGCSCGSQVDIMNPHKNGSVFITEGHFKAKEISNHFKTTAISVQGVNNTKNLDMEIPKLLKKRKIRRFIIAFDADMMHNKNVKKAALKLQKQLEKYNIPTGFMVWDEKYGKGADDVIIAGKSEKFSFVKNLKEE